jgi:ubiquinone/menaquinone biosynthesis C-methylase UbiE
MDPRLQRRVQRYGWDKAAPDYERYWQKQLAPAQRRLLDLAALQPGQRVLDVACGTGLVTFEAARAVGRRGTVHATDISEAMVERVRSEAGRRGMPWVTAERLEAEDLRVPDASFDVVLCCLGIMYVPDPLLATREMLRVLRPGGHVVVSTWGARSNCGWAEIFPIVEARVQSDVCPMFFQLGTGDRLAHVMEQAGFTQVSADRLSVKLDYPGPDDAIGAAFVGGPVALAYSRFDEPTRASAHQDYLASIDPWRRNGGYELPGEFVIARGIAPDS